MFIKHQGKINPKITIDEITNSIENKICKLKEEKEKEAELKRKECYQKCLKTHQKFVRYILSQYTKCMNKCRISYIKVIDKI